MSEDLEDLRLEAAEVAKMFGIELPGSGRCLLHLDYVYSNIRKCAIYKIGLRSHMPFTSP
jgi:hypothetical protein